MGAVLRKLVGYAAYMFGANTFTALLNFAVSALGMVTRPKEAFGDYAIYMLIYEIGNGIFIYGGNATIQKFAADSPENRVRFAKIILLLFVGLSALTGLAAAVVGTWFSLHIALALLGLPWVVTYWYGRYIVRSNLDAKREALLMVVASLANSLFQLAFLTLTDLRDALIYGDFLALVASGVMALVVMPRALGVSLRQIVATPLPKAFLKETFAFTVPLWFAGQVFTAKVRMQAVWTSARLGSKAMGALQGMLTMWQFAGKPIEYLSHASLPGLVAARDRRDELFHDLLRLCLLALPFVAIGVVGGIGLVFQTIDAISALFGRGGEPLVVKFAEVPLLLLGPAIAVPMTALEMVTNQYSIAIGRQRVVFYAQVVNVIVLGVTLVPLSLAYGIYGVVAAGAIGELGNALTFVVVLWSTHRASMRTALGWTLTSTALTAGALAPLYYFGDWPWVWTLAAPLGLLYLLGMGATGLLSVEDFRRMIRAYRSRGVEVTPSVAGS